MRSGGIYYLGPKLLIFHNGHHISFTFDFLTYSSTHVLGAFDCFCRNTLVHIRPSSKRNTVIGSFCKARGPRSRLPSARRPKHSPRRITCSTTGAQQLPPFSVWLINIEREHRRASSHRRRLHVSASTPPSHHRYSFPTQHRQTVFPTRPTHRPYLCRGSRSSSTRTDSFIR